MKIHATGSLAPACAQIASQRQQRKNKKACSDALDDELADWVGWCIIEQILSSDITWHSFIRKLHIRGHDMHHSRGHLRDTEIYQIRMMQMHQVQTDNIWCHIRSYHGHLGRPDVPILPRKFDRESIRVNSTWVSTWTLWGQGWLLKPKWTLQSEALDSALLISIRDNYAVDDMQKCLKDCPKECLIKGVSKGVLVSESMRNDDMDDATFRIWGISLQHSSTFIRQPWQRDVCAQSSTYGTAKRRWPWEMRCNLFLVGAKLSD